MSDITDRANFELIDGMVINTVHLSSIYPSELKREDDKIVYRIKMLTSSAFVYGRSLFKTEEECWFHIWKECRKVGIPIPEEGEKYNTVKLGPIKPKPVVTPAINVNKTPMHLNLTPTAKQMTGVVRREPKKPRGPRPGKVKPPREKKPKQKPKPPKLRSETPPKEKKPRLQRGRPSKI